MKIPPKDQRQFKIDEKGWLRVPPDVLRQIDLEPKMSVTFRVEGKTLVMEKAEQQGNPLDGDLSRKLDRDLFGKIQEKQAADKLKAEQFFRQGLEDAPENPEPPDNPFRWD